MTAMPLQVVPPSQAGADSARSAALVVDCRCELGEGVLWDTRRQAVLWTDIEGRRLWQYTPATGALRQWTLPDRLGSFALCESGRLLLALAKGLYLADLDLSSHRDELAVEFLIAIERDQPQLRSNDGRCDRSGNFVFGTLNQDRARAPLGRFYQFSLRHGLRELALGGVAIPNSLAFSPDGATLYFCDTTTGLIRQCNYDADRAHVDAIRPFARVAPPGSPDGATVDRDGRLWSTHWGAGRVLCYDAQGHIVDRIGLPASQPSCIAFGGAALDTAYITSAREDLDDAALAREPGAGGLFALRVAGATGLPEARFVDA